MPARRRYELRHPELDGQIEALVARVEEDAGPFDGAELVRQMLVSVIGLAREEAELGDLKMLNSALKELRHSFRVFGEYRGVRKVSVFGSARTRPEDPTWKQARRFGERMAESGWMAITGGGGGIMEAAQAGAGRDASFGANIQLPFEQRANSIIADDPKLINFRYFFSRKVTFVKESHAMALCAGGFGTLDESFETLTLIQTGKSEMMPVVCLDAPGDSYWREWHDYISSQLRDRGLISEHDMSLFHVTDDVEDAVAEILGFYRNYHSSRYVGDRLVVRLSEKPSEAQLAALNDDFSDIVSKGAIELTDALPQESHALDLPRIQLRFDRRSVGRLRQLIDRLNSFSTDGLKPEEAAPHEIVEVPLSEDAVRRRDEL